MPHKLWSCRWTALLVLLCYFCLNDAQQNPVSNSSVTPATSPPPWMETIPPPPNNETCATNVAANIIWNTTQVGRTIERLCSQADPQLLGFWSMVRRTCNTGGVWGDPDFSECTLSQGTNAFLLVWFVVQSDSVVTVNNRRQLLDEELSNISDAEIGLAATQAVTNDTVSLTFKLSFSVANLASTRQATIRDSLLTWLNEHSTLGNYTLVTNDTGYQGFMISDSCPCSATGDLFAEMCENRTPSGPCVCRSSTDCMCAQFYVGDGQRCTLDRDGDGYPDVALDTCNSRSAQARYCINDTCRDVYNPLQNPGACQNGEDFRGCRSAMGQFGILWASTAFGQTNTQLCPTGEGFATRHCSPRGWLLPSALECTTFDFVNARQKASIAFNTTGRNLQTRLQDSQAVTFNMRNITRSLMGTSLFPSDLNTTNMVLSGVEDLLDESLDTSETDISEQVIEDLLWDCVNIFSNVLDGNNLNGWLELQEVGAGSQKLLDNAEQYGLYLSNAMNDTVGRGLWARENIVFAPRRSNPEESTTFPESLDDLVITSFNSIPAQITIPAQFLMERREANARTVPVTTTIFQNIQAALPPDGNDTRVVSVVISTQVGTRQAPRQSNALLEEPVTLTFTFAAEENVSEYQCAYWNFSNPVGNGSWAFDGLEIVSSTTEDGMTTVNCTSTHLSSFAVLVDVSGILSNQGNTTSISRTQLAALQIVSYIGCAISIICLIATIIFFLSMGKQLFTSVHYFIHLNLAISLCLGYLVFVTSVQPARANQGACMFIAALLHYLFLCVFSWMLCEGIMLYLLLVVIFSSLSKKWWLFLLLGYGLPVIPVAIAVGVQTFNYGVVDEDGNLLFCWLSTANGVIWAFVAPMLAIITVNIFFLCLALGTVYRTTKTKLNSTYDSKFKESLVIFKSVFKAAIVLLPILGLTWVLGLFAVNENTTAFACLFAIFNSLQGMFIFMFHVLRSEKVWQSSCAKYLRHKASSAFKSISVTSSMIKKPPTSYGMSMSMSADNTKVVPTSMHTAEDVELGTVRAWDSSAVERQKLSNEECSVGVVVEDTQQETVADSSDNASDPHSDTDSGYKDSNESPTQTVPVEQD